MACQSSISDPRILWHRLVRLFSPVVDLAASLLTQNAPPIADDSTATSRGQPLVLQEKHEHMKASGMVELNAAICSQANRNSPPTQKGPLSTSIPLVSSLEQFLVADGRYNSVGVSSSTRLLLLESDDPQHLIGLSETTSKVLCIVAEGDDKLLMMGGLSDDESSIGSDLQLVCKELGVDA